MSFIRMKGKFNKHPGNMSTSVITLVNINDFSHYNGVMIFQKYLFYPNPEFCFFEY